MPESHLHGDTTEGNLEHSVIHEAATAARAFRRNHDWIREIEGPAADGIGVGPPVATFQEKLKSEEIGETGVRSSVGISKDPAPRQNLIRVLYDGSGGNAFHFVVQVQVIFMPVGEEGANGEALHRG